jgi:TIR domain
MADIFISYSKTDHALALKLSAFLEAEGWSVWWDKSLAAADLYRDEIMKQLAAARAVITIWTATSVKSDWVRAEAGRAKADGKLIPVKTADVAYADIPLPFGEMHTENISSFDLIRAAIVAQLAKPAVQQSAFWQITSAFKYNVLAWIGIVGSTISLFANLNGVLDLADRVRILVDHWHEWNQMVLAWVFGLIGISVPREFVPIISFIVFTAMTVIGVNLAVRAGTNSVTAQNVTPLKKKIGIFVAGALAYLVTIATVLLISVFIASTIWPLHEVTINGSSSESLTELEKLKANRLMGSALLIFMIVFPLAYLLYFVKGRAWVLVASPLFLFMAWCLLLPLGMDGTYSDYSVAAGMFSWLGLIQICWMAVILFSPLPQLTRRLGFVVLGVLTLVALSEISKLNLHQYLRPGTLWEISSPTHNFFATA